MSLAPMIIGEEEIARFKEMVYYASENPLTMDDLLDTESGMKSMPGLIDEYCCMVPIGYKIVFSHELQPDGRVRHLSITLKGSMPSVASVCIIMEYFGFKNIIPDCELFIEDLLDGGQAINVLEIIDDL